MDPIANTQICADGRRRPIDQIERDPRDFVNPAEDVPREPLPGESFGPPSDEVLRSLASGAKLAPEVVFEAAAEAEPEIVEEQAPEPEIEVEPAAEEEAPEPEPELDAGPEVVDLESMNGDDLLAFAATHNLPVQRDADVDELRDQVQLLIAPLDDLTAAKLRQVADLHGLDVNKTARVADLRAEVAAKLQADG